MKKVMFISSQGGHLTELLALKSLFSKYDYQIVTEKTKSSKYLKSAYGKKISYLLYGTQDHLLPYLFIFSFNCLYSFILFLIHRPKAIITTGTHTAVPMCYIAKLFRAKVIWIETFANSQTPTKAGRMVYKIADKFVVQWPSMLEVYPKAECWGWIF